MKYQFEKYEDRKIEFVKSVNANDCKVKVYTITNRENFESIEIFENIIKELPSLTGNIINSSIPTYKHAFLIVHESRPGVFIHLCWWTDENILETKIYFVDFDNTSEINSSIFGEKQMVCVWEMEIYYHERKAWIKHVLSHPKSPNFDDYINDYLIK